MFARQIETLALSIVNSDRAATVEEKMYSVFDLLDAAITNKFITEAENVAIVAECIGEANSLILDLNPEGASTEDLMQTAVEERLTAVIH
jgi:hypothetical protein